jgi:hypothetical protein
MRGRIESLAWPGPLDDPHQLGDGSGVARDHDLILDLKERFCLRPSLTQISDTDRLHARSLSCFTGLSVGKTARDSVERVHQGRLTHVMRRLRE